MIAAEPFLFLGHFAGDAQVHLVFMESAAGGRFFEFNPGERVSGETSIGYMLLGAALFRLMPASFVPVALKLFNLLAWYALCWLFYRVALRLLDGHRIWAGVAAVIAATLPGSVYNANVGMENGLFAAMIWLWILLAIRWRSFESNGANEREVVLASILGLACWLRPEGFLVAGIALAFRFWRGRTVLRIWLPSALITAAIGIACVVFQYAYTEDFIATSILSRRVLALPRTFGWGALSLDPTFALRLLAYLPLTAFFMAGIVRRGENVEPAERFLRWLFAAFFVLYSISGTPHLARYVIFLMPILTLGAIQGVRRAWTGGAKWTRLAAAVALAVWPAIAIGEVLYRSTTYSRHAVTVAAAAPTLRRQNTDALLHELGDPAKRPILIARESVQVRYEFDDRIVVRSLDGRVDRTLLAFVQGGAVDHVGYLREREVDYLMETPEYNRKLGIWSLARLARLGTAEVLEERDLRFRRLTKWVFEVTRR